MTQTNIEEAVINLFKASETLRFLNKDEAITKDVANDEAKDEAITKPLNDSETTALSDKKKSINIDLNDSGRKYAKKIAAQIHKCITYDVEIQKLIDICNKTTFKYDNEDVFAYINVVNLHNYEDEDEDIKGIHLDDLGLLTFEQLENKLNKSSIYVPKRKSKFKFNIYDIKEINFDYLYSIYDRDFLEKRRLKNTDECNLKKVKLISRPSLNRDKVRLLLNMNPIKSMPFNVVCKEYKKSSTSTQTNRVFYTPNGSSNVLSFILFYNKPFKLIEDFYTSGGAFEKSVIQTKNQKKTTETPVRSLLVNINRFINDSNLENYYYIDNDNNKIFLKDSDDFNKALYVDKLLFLEKIDFIFNWILFSCCFSDFDVYSEGIDSDFAYKYLMSNSKFADKNYSSLTDDKGPSISNTFSYLFLTKFYILYLLKCIPRYDIGAFVTLMNCINSQFKTLWYSNFSSDKDALVSDLYNIKNIKLNNKNILDSMMPSNLSDVPDVKIGLLNDLSLGIIKKESAGKRIFSLKDLSDKFSFDNE